MSGLHWIWPAHSRYSTQPLHAKMVFMSAEKLGTHDRTDNGDLFDERRDES